MKIKRSSRSKRSTLSCLIVECWLQAGDLARPCHPRDTRLRDGRPQRQGQTGRTAVVRAAAPFRRTSDTVATTGERTLLCSGPGGVRVSADVRELSGLGCCPGCIRPGWWIVW